MLRLSGMEVCVTANTYNPHYGLGASFGFPEVVGRGQSGLEAVHRTTVPTTLGHMSGKGLVQQIQMSYAWPFQTCPQQ